MSCLTFLSENLVDDATLSIVTGVENAQFPLTNMQSPFTTKIFRSTGNTVEVLIDNLVTQPVDSIAVVGHSVDGLGFTVMELRGSATTDFSGSTLITVDLNEENNFGFKFFTEASFRFWKITLTGNGSFAELSNIFLGKRTDFTQNAISIDSFSYQNEDNAKVRINRYGQRYIDKVNDLKVIKGSIKFLNQSEFDSLNDIFNRHGKTEPIWLITDSNGGSATDGEFLFSLYGYFSRREAFSASGFGIYSSRIAVEQGG